MSDKKKMNKEQRLKAQREALGLIERGLREVRMTRQLVTITGPSVARRALLEEQLRREKATNEVVIIDVYDGMRPRAFMGAICRALGSGDGEYGSLDGTMKVVIASLQFEPKMLVIDEAGFLTDASLNQLVHINNNAKAGIVLMGSEELNQLIKRAGLERLRSRMRQAILLEELVEEGMEIVQEEVREQKVVKGAFGQGGKGH